MKIFETLDDNTVLIDGVKYQKVEEPKSKSKSLYEMLVPPYNIVGYIFNDGQLDWICDTVENWLPPDDPHDGEEFQLGWNACLGYLRDKIK